MSDRDTSADRTLQRAKSPTRFLSRNPSRKGSDPTPRSASEAKIRTLLSKSNSSSRNMGRVGRVSAAKVRILY